MEAVEPGVVRQEQRQQISRMKQNLNTLVEEVRQLQDLMEEDAMEFAENVRTIQDEMRLARVRRSTQETPATTAGPSISNSACSSAAPSVPSSPRVGHSTLDVTELQSAIL